jgi:hypothetical protein
MSLQTAASMKEIFKSSIQCKQGVSDKDTPIEWYCHGISNGARLLSSIQDGTYHARPGYEIQIYRPKKRIATAQCFADRVWQRTMCNNGIYEDLTKSFILDNIACQKGKGADMAIRRVVAALQKLYRIDPAKPILVTHLDVKSYFPSTPHQKIKELDLKVISDKAFITYLNEIIDLSFDKRDYDEIAQDPFGERGTGLGSQINQLHQVALLNKLDHELKTFCKVYIRYNDDFLILDHDREVILRARRTIKICLNELGLEMTDKTGITTAQQGFYFLRKKFIVTKTGKIIIRLHRKALTEERENLRILYKRLQNNEITMEHVENHYQSVIANFEYAGDAPIRAMDKFYTNLFRVKPRYKRKKRYLYGNPAKKNSNRKN